MSITGARSAAANWPSQVRARWDGWRAQRALLRKPVRCEGCAVDFVPWRTGARCPVCADAVSGLNWVPRERLGRPFALRFLWIFAVVALLLLVHALYS